MRFAYTYSTLISCGNQNDCFRDRMANLTRGDGILSNANGFSRPFSALGHHKVSALIMKLLAACLWLLLPSRMAAAAASSPSDNYGRYQGSRRPTEDRKKWSGMFTVDPSKILSTLIQKGGLFIPKESQKGIEVLRRVCSVDRAELNVVEKRLLLHNFTIALPREQKALRIGRVYLHWDSYRRPCLDIEVDEVDVLVEFTNLMLTRNNWNELKDFGFPPEIATGSTADREPTKASKGKPNDDDGGGVGLVRINSIDLSKNLTILVLSRPLKKKIGSFTLDMDMADEINELIQRRSDENLLKTGRRGCTANEIAALLQDYIGQRVRQFVEETVMDVRGKTKQASDVADRMLTKASESVLRYAGDAGKKKGDELQDALTARLTKWGIAKPGESLSDLKRRSATFVSQINTTAIDERAAQARAIIEKARAEGKLDELESKLKNKGNDDFLFPDW